MKGRGQRAEGRGRRAQSLALAIVLLTGASLAAETIDRVLAVASGQLIMLSDVVAARDLGIVPAAPGGDPIGSVLATLIDRELMLAEVDRYAPPEPETADVDREAAAVRARFPSGAAYTSVLARSGFDAVHVREMVRQNLRLRAYLDQRFTAPNGDPARRQTLIDDWVAGLRRRTPAINLYTADRRP